MIGLRAFALARHWNIVVLVIVLTACAMYLCGPFAYILNPRDGYLVAVAAQLPVVSAIAIQVTLDEPRLRIPELTARRHLSRLRLLHVVGLTALAAGACAIAGSYLAGAADQTLAATTVTGLGPFGLVRNLLALTGLALVSGCLLGAQWGWVLPLAWAVVPYFVTSPRDDPAGVATLLAQPDRALLPFLVAVALFLTGTTCAARTPRKSARRNKCSSHQENCSARLWRPG